MYFTCDTQCTSLCDTKCTSLVILNVLLFVILNVLLFVILNVLLIVILHVLLFGKQIKIAIYNYCFTTCRHGFCVKLLLNGDQRALNLVLLLIENNYVEKNCFGTNNEKSNEFCSSQILAE